MGIKILGHVNDKNVEKFVEKLSDLLNANPKADGFETVAFSFGNGFETMLGIAYKKTDTKKTKKK